MLQPPSSREPRPIPIKKINAMRAGSPEEAAYPATPKIKEQAASTRVNFGPVRSARMPTSSVAAKYPAYCPMTTEAARSIAKIQICQQYRKGSAPHAVKHTEEQITQKSAQCQNDKLASGEFLA